MKNLHARVATIISACALVLSASMLNISSAQEEEFVFDTAPDLDNWSTGPEVGETIPDITGTDQHGNQRNFADIKGPNGAYVVFHRSADW
jgi:hypothetical protein